MRLLKPAIAVILFAGGVILCFSPGPGLPLIVIGAGLLADESRSVARAMDWLELRARKIITWLCRWWNRAPKFAKHAVIVLAVLAVSGAAYGGYRFISSH
ncbi:MAG TPA: PGPGW domain-containing protein [Verrucomicrobiae bacterium]